MTNELGELITSRQRLIDMSLNESFEGSRLGGKGRFRLRRGCSDRGGGGGGSCRRGGRPSLIGSRGRKRARGFRRFRRGGRRRIPAADDARRRQFLHEKRHRIVQNLGRGLTGKETLDRVSFASVHHVDELLVSRNGEERVVGNICYNSGFS